MDNSLSFTLSERCGHYRVILRAILPANEYFPYIRIGAGSSLISYVASKSQEAGKKEEFRANLFARLPKPRHMNKPYRYPELEYKALIKLYYIKFLTDQASEYEISVLSTAVIESEVLIMLEKLGPSFVLEGHTRITNSQCKQKFDELVEIARAKGEIVEKELPLWMFIVFCVMALAAIWLLIYIITIEITKGLQRS